ncbi:MAG: hypothetical protein RLZ63_1142 [Pseudomonadota bacterium]|jgi:malonyl-CoA O-methyltransferase
MTDVTPPSMDAVAAQRWLAGVPMQVPPVSPWLHEEVARRMMERLDIITTQPQQWAHWQPVRGGWQAHQALRTRYPEASAWLVPGASAEDVVLRKSVQHPWWKVWRRQDQLVGLPPAGSVQMVWANMALHQHARPQALMAQWHKALAVDGFLMFSCLGPDTLRELRDLYSSMGSPQPMHELTDMHDWGDMLVQAGFAEPVMDMERITLTFETPERLVQELRELGRNLAVGRDKTMHGRAWHGQWLQALSQLAQPRHGGKLGLTFEIVYGHAFKPAPRHRVAQETGIDLFEMRQMLRGSVKDRSVG